MQAFADAGIAPTLQDVREHKLSYREYYRITAEKEVRECEDPNTLQISPRVSCWPVNMGFRVSPPGSSGDGYQDALHDMWWNFYLYSKFIPANSLAMFEHAFRLAQIQGQGTLMRFTARGGPLETAPTSEGMIWSDLPYFSSDMMKFWVRDFAGMSGTQRVNFSSFLAKLASIGLIEDKLCGVALMTFREALETPRALGEITNAEEDAARFLTDLTICDFLPALQTWQDEAAKIILQLSGQSQSHFPDTSQEIGVLYRDDGSNTTKTPGFSPERWVFWLRRLDEIHQEAEKDGKKEIVDCTAKILYQMSNALAQIATPVQGAFDASSSVINYRIPGSEDFPPFL